LEGGGNPALHSGVLGLLLKIAMGREAWHGIWHGTSSSVEAETDGLIVSRNIYG